MNHIKNFICYFLLVCLGTLGLCSCNLSTESYIISEINYTDTEAIVNVEVSSSNYEKFYVVILNDNVEFDRKILTKNGSNYESMYKFDGLMPNTNYTVNLLGVKDEVETLVASDSFTTDNAKTDISFEDQIFDYTGLEIVPQITNMPSDAIVVFTPENIYDAGVYDVKAEILFEDNREMTLYAKITVRKVSYPLDYIFEVTPSKPYTGNKVTFDYILIDDFETELTYIYNGNVVSEMVNPGNYKVELLIKESLNYKETLLEFDFTIVEKELDIFISEYFEGYYHKDYNPNGNNNDKAIELYNPTKNKIDLSDYIICVYKSGETSPNNVVNLSGFINPGETFVVANLYSSDALKEYADMLGELYFSGKQTVALYHGDTLIDILGEIGYIYDEPLTINGIIGAFANNRLVRKAGIVGNSVFKESEWIVIGNCEYTDLGHHSF